MSLTWQIDNYPLVLKMELTVFSLAEKMTKTGTVKIWRLKVNMLKFLI